MEWNRVRIFDFMVHFETETSFLQSVEFEVYPVQDWSHALNLSKGTSYIDKENENEMLAVFQPDKCLKKFQGSLCWRGRWEGRIYFTDDEYWAEELREMTDLYENHIAPWCREFIKNRNPGDNYDGL